MKRRLITSALPYVNNIPHLGNLIQVLSVREPKELRWPGGKAGRE